jgi:imidazolonepropionase-like amidohydrolase
MVTILRAARLLLDSSSDLIYDGAVVVKDGRIADAGSWDALVNGGAISSQEDIRDLGDVTLMPGLFDCHVCLFCSLLGIIEQHKALSIISPGDSKFLL